jgi:16S rRNA (cytosine967-C5)-methyltransferase
VRVVERVLRDSAFLAPVLDAELSRRAELSARDKGLATELAYGTLRVQPALERRVLALSPRGVSDERVLAELLVAAYQILLLERVPAFAAVDAAVSSVKRVRGDRVAGFVNAVLRKLAATGERLTPRQALLESIPEWLTERLRAEIGEQQLVSLLTDEAMTGLRLRLDRAASDWIEALPRGRVSPAARLARGLGDLRQRAGYAEGDFTVQEEGAQVVGLLLGARPGERVLDACAGRGQKATLLAERIGATRVVAADMYPAKLAALEQESARLGLGSIETHALDWTLGHADVPADFDRVLVDAPCSGSGTLRRRPEILRRLKADDPARLAELSERILRGAASRAKPGGRVLFAVCSVLRAEAETMLERVRDALEPVPFDAPELAPELTRDKTTLRLLPGVHGTDGYFVASLRRRR